MITLSTLLFLLWSLLNAAVYVYLLKEKFSRVITVSFLGQIIISYIIGIIFKSVIKIPLIIDALVISLVVISLMLNKDKRTEFLKNYFTPGLLVYIFLFFILVFFQRNKTIGCIDDYMHWGLFIKDILNYDMYSAMCQNPFAWFHSDYPPLIQTFESLFMFICNSGYVEWYGLFSISLFSLSMMLAPIDTVSLGKKDIIKSVAYLILVVLCGLFLNNTPLKGIAMFYQTLVVDTTISFILAFCLYNIISRNFDNECDYIITGIIFTVIILIKQIAVCFYILMIACILLKLIIKKKAIKIRYLIYLAAIPLLFFTSWNIVVNFYQQEGQFVTSNINVSDILGIAQGTKGLEWQHITFNNYIDALFNRNLHNGLMKLTYFQIIVISAIFIAIMMYIAHEDKKIIIITEITILTGAVGYAIAMLLSYVFLFNDSEGPVLAEFDRYMQIYIVFCFLFIIIWFIKYIFYRINKKTLSILLLLVFVSVFQIDFSTLKTLKQSSSFPANDIAVELNRYLSETTNEEKILVIDQFVPEFDYQYNINVYLRYEIAKKFNVPYKDKIQFSSFSHAGEWKEKFIDLIIVGNPDSFRDYLDLFDFVYIDNANEYLIELFNDVTDEYFLTNRLYRVVKLENDIDLVLIDHVNTMESTRMLNVR